MSINAFGQHNYGPYCRRKESISNLVEDFSVLSVGSSSYTSEQKFNHNFDLNQTKSSLNPNKLEYHAISNNNKSFLNPSNHLCTCSKRDLHGRSSSLRGECQNTYNFYSKFDDESSDSSLDSNDKSSTDSFNSSKCSLQRKTWSLTSSSSDSEQEQINSSDSDVSVSSLFERGESRLFQKDQLFGSYQNSAETEACRREDQVTFFAKHLSSLTHKKTELLITWRSLPETIKYKILGMQVRIMCDAHPERLFEATKLLSALVPECPSTMQEFIAEKLQGLRQSSPHWEVRRAAMEVLIDSGILLTATKFHPAYRPHDHLPPSSLAHPNRGNTARRRPSFSRRTGDG